MSEPEIRQSQLLTTFGPGSLVDLPHDAVMIGGLEHWVGEKQRVNEERLEARIAEMMGVAQMPLYAPPIDSSDPAAPETGVRVFLFPLWYLGQVQETYRTAEGREYRTRPLVRHDRLVQGGYLTTDRKQAKVVPVRFVQACKNGHISDVNWYAFVERSFSAEQIGQLWLDEGGAGNDFAEIFVRNERTGKRRPLADAMVPGLNALGKCNGRMPWIGEKIWEDCQEHSKLLNRTATNAYFSQTLSAIAIPDAQKRLRDSVASVFDDFLQYCESAADIARERKKAKVATAIEALTDDAVWAEVDRRKNGVFAPRKPLKVAELETLLSQAAASGADEPDGDFYARSRSLGDAAKLKLDRVVLVHRLREVNAQLGFTRFEAELPDVNGELSLGVTRAPLARNVTWLPAIENRGEGVFLSFSKKAIEDWVRLAGVKDRDLQLEKGFRAWAKRRKLEDAQYPGVTYMMLHSLSHLLLTSVALDCGYAVSAIRERIYASAGLGYGILLHTGTAGSEGTLGGLVDVGRRIEHHLRRALELGRLCSNDPVCSQHDPASTLEERYLQGAACHGCLLISETSCERRNEHLDRTLVVPTVASSAAAFYGAK